MKTCVFAALLALVSLASAARHGPQGSVYILSNEPTGNKIIAADISANGTLSFGSSTDAGGLGGEEVTFMPGLPDPLNTQGSIAVHRDAGLLLTVNAGSNSVALFSINRRNPSLLTMVGDPVASYYGDIPIAMAINEEATFACVVTSGIQNGVGCYAVSPVDGLVPLGNSALGANFRSLGLQQVNPPSQQYETASEITFSADGKKVIVATKGNVGNLTPATITPGFVATFDIDETGILSGGFKRTEIGAFGGAFPFSLTRIDGHDDAYLSADPVLGYHIFDFEHGPSDGVAKVIPTAIPGQNATCWSTYSEGTGNYYVTDPVASTMSEIHINDDLSSNVVNKYPLGENTGPLDLGSARIGGKDFVYVLIPGGTNGPEIWTIALHGPGNAEVLQRWNPADYGVEHDFTLDFQQVQGLGVYTKCS